MSAGALVITQAASAHPELKALSFSVAAPGSPKTNLTVAFTAASEAAVTYVEITFSAADGIQRRGGSLRFNGGVIASGSVELHFPQFAGSDVWTLERVFLADAAGSTAILKTGDIRGLGFPTQVKIESKLDSTTPVLTVLSFAPLEIDTTRHAALVSLDFSANDDLSGVNYIEAVFSSPSGVNRRNGSLRLPPARAASGTVEVSFPPQSEAGTWVLEKVFLSDAAGNSRIVDTNALKSMGVRNALTVVSRRDNTPPAVAAVRLSQPGVNIAGGRTMKVDVVATDDLSGVISMEAVFTSPSGTVKARGAATLDATEIARCELNIDFPVDAERGTWTFTTLLVSDLAGNVTALDTDSIRQRGFPAVLVVE